MRAAGERRWLVCWTGRWCVGRAGQLVCCCAGDGASQSAPVCVPPALLFRRQACRESPTSLAEAEQAVLEFVQRHVPEPSIAQIAGNSVHVDLAFLRKHMPRLVDHLSYRIVDVSTVGELCRRWFPREHSRAPKKRNTHTAMSGGWVGEWLPGVGCAGRGGPGRDGACCPASACPAPMPDTWHCTAANAHA